MEFYEGDFMEELMALKRENNQFFTSNDSSYSFDYTTTFDQNSLSFPNSSSTTPQQFNEIYNSCFSLLDHQPSYTTPQNILDPYYSYSNNTPLLNTPPLILTQEEFPLSMLEELEDDPVLLGEELENLELQTNCKMEATQSPEMPLQLFNTTTALEISERKNRPKKIQGQPSKNLMAERRRRKRLNDRLSMLRAIVPKISKMDRTSILGDTIDYMKELLEKINNLKQQSEVDSNIFKDVKPSEILVRNSPKFEVERSEETRIEICCAGKPGLLLSTVNTLEALGLEIQQCVISCFNDFTMQASCSEDLEGRTMVSSEDIKQALFRSAGYGGRCL